MKSDDYLSKCGDKIVKKHGDDIKLAHVHIILGLWSYLRNGMAFCHSVLDLPNIYNSESIS